jgi:hypothetical protein
MKQRNKAVLVQAVEVKTGNKAPAIATSIHYDDNGKITDQQKKSAIAEGKDLSRLGDSKLWKFQVATNTDATVRRIK